MRLIKPPGVLFAGTLRKMLALILLLIVIAGSLLIYRHYHPKTSNGVSGIVNVNDSIINDYKNSNDLSNKRSIISAYSDKGDYESALRVAQQVADTTKGYQDYMAVLTICGLHNVKNSDSCIKQDLVKLKPLIDKLSFTGAYAAGGILEKKGLKKDAADFYQKAYDIYDANAGGDNTMSKDQLKAHVDELRA